MTIFEAYQHTKKTLAAAGIEEYVTEAKHILRHVTGMTNMQILTRYNEQLSPFAQNNLTAILRQREIHYPLQYILGEWWFYGYPFAVGPGVLAPRADTECVVEKCLDFLKGKEAPRVLDLCAGSGCIGIAIAKECPQAEVLLVEKYPEAMRYSTQNIEKNGAENARVLAGDVMEKTAADQCFDLIVSNPPYVAAGEKEIMSPETEFEPETAFFGGEDGLDFYRAILAGYAGSLAPGGMLIFEVGAKQSAAVTDLMREAGFSDIGTKEDLNGIKRAVFATSK